MATYRTVDALDLEPGQLILTAPGRFERVCTRSELGEHSGVVIHTDDSDILTGWPCAILVVTG